MSEDDKIPAEVLEYLREGNCYEDLAQLFWEALNKDAQISLIQEVIDQNLIIATEGRLPN